MLKKKKHIVRTTKRATIVTLLPANASIDKREKYVPIGGCPRCNGAVFSYMTNIEALRRLFQCFNCARLYERINGKYELWIKRKEELKEKST